MKKISLNLESVQALSRDQQKNILGGRLEVKNLQATGQVIYHGGNAVCQCSWDYNEYDGTGWHTRTGPCPTGSLEYSCI